MANDKGSEFSSYQVVKTRGSQAFAFGIRFRQYSQSIARHDFAHAKS